MNVLIVSHAPWRNTGYGRPAYELSGELEKRKHLTAIMAVEERGVCKMEYFGIPVYMPPVNDPYGRGFCQHVVKDFGADVVITLLDAWVYGDSSFAGGKPWLAWCPIDQDPPQRGLDVLSDAAVVLPFSNFGAKALARFIPDSKIVVMPYGIDLKTFKRDTDGARAKHRSRLGLDEQAFVVGMVGTNLPRDRKAFRENITGFADFAFTQKNARLLIWSTNEGDFRLSGLINELGMSDQIKIVSGFDVTLNNNADRMAEFYNSLDVLLHASAAEGFGLPIIEAQACGVPVIGANNTSMPELITDRTGWLVKDLSPVWSWLDGYWMRPTPAGIARELRSAYDYLHDGMTGKLVAADCAGAAKQWSWEIVGEKWDEVLLDNGF